MCLCIGTSFSDLGVFLRFSHLIIFLLEFEKLFCVCFKELFLEFWGKFRNVVDVADDFFLRKIPRIVGAKHDPIWALQLHELEPLGADGEVAYPG